MENEPDTLPAAPEPEPSPPPAPAEPEPLRPNSTIEVRGGESPSKSQTNLIESHKDTDE